MYTSAVSHGNMGLLFYISDFLQNLLLALGYRRFVAYRRLDSAEALELLPPVLGPPVL